MYPEPDQVDEWSHDSQGTFEIRKDKAINIAGDEIEGVSACGVAYSMQIELTFSDALVE